MQLSKLATPTVQLFNKKLLAQRMGAIVLAQAQKRNVQSEYKPGKAISFIDMMSGAYVCCCSIASIYKYFKG